MPKLKPPVARKNGESDAAYIALTLDALHGRKVKMRVPLLPDKASGKARAAVAK